MGTKTTKTTRFSNHNKNKVGLVLNLDHETKQTKTRTWHMQINNPTRFYCKEETKIEQGYDKKRTQNWCWTD